ncbi:MAG: ferric reductase-like transmembrane domain-containing protein [Pseudomonadota bacterium]
MSRGLTIQLLTCTVLALPALWLGWQISLELSAPGTRFGADPGEAVTDFLGEWAMRVLLLALAVSPLRRFTGWRALAPLRRTVGLFAFGYALAHVLAYAGFLKGFELSAIFGDLTERSYIIAGAVAIAALVPLAVTSTRAWQRRLRQRWQQLHRLVFVAMGAALVHLLWLTRDGYGEPLLYLLIFALLLAERGWHARQRSRASAPSRSRAQPHSPDPTTAPS